jgi:hypothetical protein
MKNIKNSFVNVPSYNAYSLCIEVCVTFVPYVNLFKFYELHRKSTSV